MVVVPYTGTTVASDAESVVASLVCRRGLGHVGFVEDVTSMDGGGMSVRGPSSLPVGKDRVGDDCGVTPGDWYGVVLLFLAV